MDLANVIAYMFVLAFVVFVGIRIHFSRKQDWTYFTPEAEYVEYESRHYLDKIWYDESKIGICYRCGMDDAPVRNENLLAMAYNSDVPRIGLCKYCEELEDLNKHLRNQKSHRSPAKAC